MSTQAMSTQPMNTTTTTTSYSPQFDQNDEYLTFARPTFSNFPTSSGNSLPLREVRDVGKPIKEVQREVGRFLTSYAQAKTSKETPIKHLDTYAKLDISARSLIKELGKQKIKQVAVNAVEPIMAIRYEMLKNRWGFTENNNAGMFLINLAARLFQNPKCLDDEEVTQRLEDQEDEPLRQALEEVEKALHSVKEEDETLLLDSQPKSLLHDNSISHAARAQVLLEVGAKYDILTHSESERLTSQTQTAAKASTVARKTSLKGDQRRTQKYGGKLGKLVGESDDSSTIPSSGKSQKTEDMTDTGQLTERLSHYKALLSSHSRLAPAQEREHSTSVNPRKTQDQDAYDIDEADTEQSPQPKVKNSNDAEALFQIASAYGTLRERHSRLGDAPLHSSKDTRAQKIHIKKIEAAQTKLVLTISNLEKQQGKLAKQLEGMGGQLEKIPEDVSNPFKAVKFQQDPKAVLKEYLAVMKKLDIARKELEQVKINLEMAQSQQEPPGYESDISEKARKPFQKDVRSKKPGSLDSLRQKERELGLALNELYIKRKDIAENLKKLKEKVGSLTQDNTNLEEKRSQAYKELLKAQEQVTLQETAFNDVKKSKPTQPTANLAVWNEQFIQAVNTLQQAQAIANELERNYRIILGQQTSANDSLTKATTQLGIVDKSFEKSQQKINKLTLQYHEVENQLKKLNPTEEVENGEGYESEFLTSTELMDLEKNKGPEFRAVINLVRTCITPGFYDSDNATQTEQLFKWFSQATRKQQESITQYLYAKSTVKESGDDLQNWIKDHIADDKIALIKACEQCFKSK